MCQCLFFAKFAGLSLITFVKKETLTEVFSCEFCEIYKNTFTEHFWATASKNASIFFQLFDPLVAHAIEIYVKPDVL